jgi:2,3-dihydroxybiphenyl 1,2-dioxygenase
LLCQNREMVSGQEQPAMGTTSVQALGYIELGVSSIADWRQYAQHVLGVACVDVGDALHLRYDRDCWRIRLVETGEDDIRCAGFQVASVADMAKIRAQLEAHDVEVAVATDAEAASRGVTHLLRCVDPSGLPVELYIGARTVDEEFASPLGISGFVTGAQGLGHMVLAGADQQEAEPFYVQCLGFKLSDHIVLGPPDRQLTLTFLHCNPRHHTLALAPVPSPKRLNHIMLQVASMDDVGSGLDAAHNAGVKISSSLGKHTNDRTTSFYMRTPSGFDIEYGCGGIEIDDSTWQPSTHHATSLWGHKGLAGR